MYLTININIQVIKMSEKIDMKNYQFTLSQNNSLEIPENVLREWQSILDILARIGKVRAALIMKMSGEDLEVFMSSKTPDNPYSIGHKNRYVDSGLYCERVLKQGSMLMVPDAGESAEWKNNPDMKYNMRCYLGFPIKLPGGGYFGTICLLDTKKNDFSQDIKDCMEKMRDLIENNLLLIYLSATDRLTGLYNRTYFNEKIESEIMFSQKKNTPITAMMLDIDHFKNINDTQGHLAGDNALMRFAGTIVDSLRKTDIAFRLGGDEFFILMPNTSLNDALTVADRLCNNIKNSRIIPNSPVTASVGVVEHMPDESSERWYVRLDNALYEAKKKFGNQIAK